MFLLFLLWAYAFDRVMNWLKGGLIETALNWISNAGFWVTIIVFASALLASIFCRKT